MGKKESEIKSWMENDDKRQSRSYCDNSLEIEFLNFF